MYLRRGLRSSVRKLLQDHAARRITCAERAEQADIAGRGRVWRLLNQAQADTLLA